VRLGQGIGALLLDRVLRRDHHELVAERMGLAVDGDRALVHRLQQRRLRLGRGRLISSANSFVLTKGPIFTQILLADEINRTPPKTQAALLQAMNERAITIDGQTHPLGDEFMVIATQNPIEQQGTYPLPEAQLDRFLFKINLGYPSRDEEREIVGRHGHRSAMPAIADFGWRPWPTASGWRRRAPSRPGSG